MGFYVYYLIESSEQLYEVQIVILILQMKNLKAIKFK